MREGDFHSLFSPQGPKSVPGISKYFEYVLNEWIYEFLGALSSLRVSSLEYDRQDPSLMASTINFKYKQINR